MEDSLHQIIRADLNLMENCGKSVILQQLVAEIIKKLGFELLEHPPYGPDMTVRDFHVFEPLKQFLLEKKIYNSCKSHGYGAELIKNATTENFSSKGQPRITGGGREEGAQYSGRYSQRGFKCTAKQKIAA